MPNTRNREREKFVCSMKSSDENSCYVLVAGRTVAINYASNQFKFSSKILKKQLLEKSGDKFFWKHRRVTDEKVKITSTSRSFRQNV